MMTDDGRRLAGARKLAVAAVLSTGIACSAGAADDAPSLDGLAWMAGHWSARFGDLVMEEYWSAPRGGLMLGLHRDTRGEERAFFEYLRIEAGEDGIVYLASPLGRPPTPFRLVEQGERRVVFENPEHDFPQRITYALDGDVLVARAESLQDGSARPQEWRWNRTGGERNDARHPPD